MILCTCTGWSESAHFAHGRRHFFGLMWLKCNIESLTRLRLPGLTLKMPFKTEVEQSAYSNFFFFFRENKTRGAGKLLFWR